MNRKIVWVLGSGFSQPLGGPTLADLLSRASEATVQKIFPKNHYPELYDGGCFDFSYRIFKLGLSPSDNKLPQMWADAEQYLDYLDTAVTFPNGPAAARLSSINENVEYLSKIEIPKLKDITRRIIAAECSVFLEGSSSDLETWQPYIRWASMLDKNHTIITFNYDRVLEILTDVKVIKNINKFGHNSFFGISGYNNEMIKDMELVKVVKLHGSVDWRIVTSQSPQTIERGDPHEALKCNTDQLVIATPGPTKHKMVSEILSSLWVEAEKELSKADVVVFVGYRFPLTDAEARIRLMEALTKNTLTNLRFYIVLGPNNNLDNQRVENLLHNATSKQSRPIQHILLGAEEFMSVFQPEQLFK